MPRSPPTLFTELRPLIGRNMGFIRHNATVRSPIASLEQNPAYGTALTSMGDEVLHVPPPAEQLPQRLIKMCRFANGQEIDTFLHPVVRAIIPHFWLAYDHPFADGNGRTARVLFYWSMLSQGHWFAEFLAISRILQAHRGRYDRSFLYTETDDRDITYFIMEQLRVVMEAISELEGYLQRKMAEIKRTERMFRSTDLNHRQVALLSHASRHPDHPYTV